MVERMDALGPPWTPRRGTLMGPTPSTVVGPSSEPGALLTVRQVAQHLAVSRAPVYRLFDRGELPHLRVSSCIRIRREDLDDFIRRRDG